MTLIRDIKVKGRGATLGHFVIGGDLLGNKGKKRIKIQVRT